MRNPIRAISLAPAILAVTLFCGVALPAFASGGDDKPVASSPTPTSIPVANTAAKPDREKKVFTNDDIDQMFPKQQVSVVETQTAEPRALTPQALRPPISAQRTVNASVSPEKDPVWYAQQIESLNSQLDSVSSKEASLREFRATGTAPDVTIGLQFGVEPEGFTTDNEVEQLAIRRQEIEQQIAALEDLAQQNGLPAGTLQNASEILQAAQKPLSPAQERAALVEKQDQLVSDLDDVHAELSYMSAQMAAQGGTLLPPTPGYGGNLTTNLITSLDNRSSEIKQAIDQNEDAARRAGLASSALP
jgi:vacuolar-type H+-ATPase subunit I/STV1